MNNKPYRIINREHLVSDYNTDNTVGSYDLDIINPGPDPVDYTNGLMLKRRYGQQTIGEPYVPVLGYCILFDSNNPNAYISTQISSGLYDEYNIIIKGEGTVEILYVDHSGSYIQIKQRRTLTSGENFYLSYIAFQNKETKEIEHLFECEEKSGTTLYDAITGDTATLSSVASITAMRVSYIGKEYIRNPELNLIDTFTQHDIKPNAMHTTGKTPLKGFGTRTYCLTWEVSEDYDTTKNNWSGWKLIGDLFFESNAYWGHHFQVTTNGLFSSSWGIGERAAVAYSNVPYVNQIFGEGSKTGGTRSIIRKGLYKFVGIVNVGDTAAEAKCRIYINGALKYTYSKPTSDITNTTVKWSDTNNCTLAISTSGNFRNLPTAGTGGDSLVKAGDWSKFSVMPGSISNIQVFSSDISAEGSPYTVDDYFNGVIPEPLTENLVYSSGNLTISKYNQKTVSAGKLFPWLDRSGNENNMYFISFAGQSNSKCYGTWLNSAGYALTNGVYIPRKIIASESPLSRLIWKQSINDTYEQINISDNYITTTGTIGYEYESDGTLVVKTTSDLTVVSYNLNSDPITYLPMLGLTSNTLMGGSSNDKLKLSWDYFYVNPNYFEVSEKTNHFFAFISNSFDQFFIEFAINSVFNNNNWNSVETNKTYYYQAMEIFPIGNLSLYKPCIGLMFPKIKDAVNGKTSTIPNNTILYKIRGAKLEKVVE